MFGRTAVLALLGSICALAQSQSPSGSIRPLVLNKTEYRLHAGESTSIDTPRLKSISAVTTSPELRYPIRASIGFEGQTIKLSVPPTTPTGAYVVSFTALDSNGVTRAGSVRLAAEPLQLEPVPSVGTVPVILLNGWQFTCDNTDSTIAASTGTFGQLASQLQGAGESVGFFNNCSYPDISIESLAGQLGALLDSLTYSDGTPILQFDVVAHSMGGLIARAYLAGLQGNGSLAPLVNPRVRKLILIATPNFGSFYAGNYSAVASLGTQSGEMIPGSAFLWNLGTWNQRGDDLRGVDALAIIGNGGPWTSSWLFPTTIRPNASDGVVSLTSASIGFAVADPSRTRILPYCHTDQIQLDCPLPNQPSIANTTEAPDTGAIVLSFLAGTSEWMSIGGTPTTDLYLSHDGGVYFGVETAADQYLSDLNQSSVYWGATELNSGGAADTVFYNEFVAGGGGSFQATSASLNQITYGPVTVPAGYYSTFRAKFSPAISGVGPILASGPGWVVQSGGTISINGVGFGSQQCSGCQVIVAPSGSAGVYYSLPVSSWTNQAITASFLPATLPNLAIPGLVTIYVELSSSAWDSINIVAAAPAAVLTISKTHAANFTRGQDGATYTVTVSNAAGAGPTSGTVTVTEAVPTGLTLVAMSGTGWNCTSLPTCTRSDPLAAGSSYLPITVSVNVAANAPATVSNQVSVSGGGFTAAASASDSTTIVALPVLSIAESHSGSFTQGQNGATYTVTVSNAAGAGPTSGTVTVTEAVPTGLTLVAMSGTGWNCTSLPSCTRNDPLAAGSSYLPITVSVNVAANAPATVSNQVSVSGGGFMAAASASDSTTIVALPVLSIAESHSGSFTQGQNGATYTVTVSNAAGAGPTSGTVTVTEAVPTGLTLVAMSGTGWNCTSLPTCTRSDPLAAGATYSAITVTANVNSNAPSSVTNQVSVSGGGSATTNASDLTYISAFSPCDLKQSGSINAADVPLMINEALGVTPAVNVLNGVVNVVGVQIEINAALGLGCISH